MPKTRRLDIRKSIALVAHDHKKKDLIEWAEYNKTALARHELVSTGTTGKLLEDKLDRPVKESIEWSIRWRPTDWCNDSHRRNRRTYLFLGSYGGATAR
jgi:hypothetical protein